jgi:Interferon-induced 6-16 family
VILACWSVEFTQELETLLPRTAGGNESSAPAPAQEQQPLVERAVCYAKSHPYLTALQASSAIPSAFSLGAPLLLNLAGFSAAGPVAGTVATTWQSSMGVVKAGSLFSWCQSAAKGGKAAAGISAAGVVGSGDVSGEILDRYQVVFRKGPVGGGEADGNGAEENEQCED